MFQIPGPKVDRKDHIWIRRATGYKCCLCGALAQIPPPYPTAKEWMPTVYAPVTPKDREACPFIFTKTLT